MMNLQTVMGLIVTGGLFFVPETPRFLAKAGRMEEARKVMLDLRDGDEALANAGNNDKFCTKNDGTYSKRCWMLP